VNLEGFRYGKERRRLGEGWMVERSAASRWWYGMGMVWRIVGVARAGLVDF
jgi:hypothetical protein